MSEKTAAAAAAAAALAGGLSSPLVNWAMNIANRNCVMLTALLISAASCFVEGPS